MDTFFAERLADEAEFFTQQDADADADDAASEAPSDDVATHVSESDESPHVSIPLAQDATVYRKTFLTLDSRFRDYQSLSSSDFYHSFPMPLRNVIGMRLMSLEVPHGVYPFSLARRNTQLTVDGRAVTLPDGYYATVTDLLKALNSVFTAANVNLVATRLQPSLRVKLTTTSTVPLTLQFGSLIANAVQDNTLGRALGFQYPSYSLSSAVPLFGERLPSVDIDSYYLLQVDDIGTMVHFMGTDTIPVLTKLQIPSGQWGRQLLVDPTNCVMQGIVFPQPITLRKWHVRLLDAWGNVVDNNDLTMSLTVEVTQIYSADVAEQQRLNAVPAAVA